MVLQIVPLQIFAEIIDCYGFVVPEHHNDARRGVETCNIFIFRLAANVTIIAFYVIGNRSTVRNIGMLSRQIEISPIRTVSVVVIAQR